jgi:hypothetical protein
MEELEKYVSAYFANFVTPYLRHFGPVQQGASRSAIRISFASDRSVSAVLWPRSLH